MRYRGIATLTWLAWSGLALAQNPNGNHSRVATAVYTDAQIAVDGRLNDPAWESAEVIDSFTSKEPQEGKPLSQRTEVRILYNKQYLTSLQRRLR